MSTRALRDNLADVIDKAAHDDEPTIVTRRGREVAAVVSIGEFRALRAYEDAADARLVDAALAEPGPYIPMAEVLAETLARKE